MTASAEDEYLSLARAELASLLEALDALGEAVEPELANDILTIEFPDGQRFVINSHRAARQIWMAAGSTAWHFDHDAAGRQWIATKSGAELWATIEQQLSKKLGRSLTLRAARS